MSELIKVADAWEKTRRGNNPGTYIVAVAGGMKFLLLRKNREEPNGSTWTLFVTERSQRQERPPAYQAERGRSSGEAVSERAESSRAFESAAGRSEPPEVEPIPPEGDECPF